uniref:Uncharacterized protein n=1 Tax=Rhizophora mucronata TaxID=61149 RepID=A0A2P2LDU1_RHIMU
MRRGLMVTEIPTIGTYVPCQSQLYIAHSKHSAKNFWVFVCHFFHGKVLKHIRHIRRQSVASDTS